MNSLAHNLLPLFIALLSAFLICAAIYFSIRYLAYKRSFSLPHRFDFLWILASLMSFVLITLSYPPFDHFLSPKLFSVATFITFLLFMYLCIFIIDQFLVEYFLVTVLKMYVSPPIRKALVLLFLVLAVIVGVQTIFNINPWAIYAPTSMLSIGIGIALKDSFQMLFAGISLSRIIHIGDWIEFQDKRGEVIDIDWARTILKTQEGSKLYIPNNELQKGIFSNLTPDQKHFVCHIDVGVSYDIPPYKVQNVIQNALRDYDGKIPEKNCDVFWIGFGDSSILYRVNFGVQHFSLSRQAISDVGSKIWQAFQRESIEIPFPIRTVIQPKINIQAQKNLTDVLSYVDLFEPLLPEDKQKISQELKFQHYAPNEIIVSQGDSGDSFFIIEEGEVEVILNLGLPTEKTLSKLQKHQFFGELSLLTGAMRAATVKSITPCVLLKLEKYAFENVLKSHPELADKLATIVTQHQQQLSKAQVWSNVEEKETKVLSDRIRKFFSLS